jgi:hypothetical protein
MIRGIERRRIFRKYKDRDDFLERLSSILPETNTSWLCLGFPRQKPCPFSIQKAGRRQYPKPEVFLLLVCQRAWGEYDRRSKIIRLTQPVIGYAVERGERLAKKTNMICLTNFLVFYGRYVLTENVH